jgi:hypothetical protein
MWNFIDNLPQDSLDSWYRWLTFFAIGLPIVGAIMGGICGWGAFTVSNRIGDLQAAALGHAQQTIDTLKPWHLSDDQQKNLTEELRSFSAGKILFAHRLMDGEGEDFAEQLAAIFKASGWSIVGIGGNSLNELPGKVTVAIDARSGAGIWETADRLCRALTRVGIPCGGDMKPNSLGGPIGLGEICIVLGRKQRHVPD